jgi:hypothetical protein
MADSVKRRIHKWLIKAPKRVQRAFDKRAALLLQNPPHAEAERIAELVHRLPVPAPGKLSRAHVDISKDATESTNPQRATRVDGNYGPQGSFGQHVMASMNPDNVEALGLQKAHHLCPGGSGQFRHGRGRLAPDPNAATHSADLRATARLPRRRRQCTLVALA